MMLKIKIAKKLIPIAFGLILVIFMIFGGMFQTDPADAVTFEEGILCVADKKNLTPESIDKSLQGKGVFDGKGDVFLKSAKDNDIDVLLFMAIALHETGMGTSHAVKTKNNPGGIMQFDANGKSSLRHFPTLDEGIQYMGDLLGDYKEDGLDTPAEIGQKYAPVGASNDPNNLNSHWVKNVTLYYGELADCQATLASGFIRPIKNPWIITSPFGPRNGGGVVSSIHHGLDLGCTGGKTPIYAVKPGTVKVAKFGAPGSGFGGYGNVVVIDHGDGNATLYAHLSTIKVDEGATVGQGQPVGICGSTGNSTGPHLHFEIRIGGIHGKQVDPLPYLKENKTGSTHAMGVAGDDYPYKNDSWHEADPWAFYKRECVSFVAHRINKTLKFAFTNNMRGGHFGNANTWDDNARNIGFTVNNTPKVGAVAQWNSGPYGHVAYVAEVKDGGRTIVVEEYNKGGTHKYGTRTISASTVDNFIHIVSK